MQKMYRQTKQAFLFSLVFYSLSLILLLFQLPIAPVMLSVSLLVSMIWVVLVMLEIMRSPHIDNLERMGLALFIIVMNIFAGIIYFTLIRRRVTGISNTR